MAGSILFAMALLHFAHALFPSIPTYLSGFYAWVVLVWLLIKLPTKSFIQFYALAGIGVILLMWALSRGASISLNDWFTQNNGLIVMLYGVSFLRLSALPKTDSTSTQQQGWTSFLGNFFGIQAMGAVINLSILVLVGEYFKNQHLLNRPQITLMSRAFATAAFWSPFFASMGVALTYASGSTLLGILSFGLGLALIGIVVSLIEFKYIVKFDIAHFQGYPLKLNSLALPLLLALSIIILHYLIPNLPILTLVASIAILLSTLLLFIKRRPVAEQLAAHIQAAPLRMAREISLFLGAGVLTLGLQTLLSTYPDLSLFKQFTGLEASLVLGLSIVVALIGVHPLISIALIGPMASPLVPNANVLGLLFLSIWSLGVVASPLSGTNVMIRGQLGVSGKDLFRWHIGYVIVMWFILSIIFSLLLS